MEARRLYRPACLGGAGQLAAAEQGWFSFRERNKEKNQVLPWISWDIRHMWIADTLHGKVYECPVVEGVRFLGDGYTHCEASGSGRCEINNGGCWKETRDGCTYSACAGQDYVLRRK